MKLFIISFLFIIGIVTNNLNRIICYVLPVLGIMVNVISIDLEHSSRYCDSYLVSNMNRTQ